MGLRKHEDNNREIEKLRGELQSLENEMRHLYETRMKLQQSQKQNERLTANLLPVSYTHLTLPTILLV